MSSDDIGSASGPPVDREDLIAYFLTGCLSRRPGARALVGAEFEHLPADPASGAAWPWSVDGARGVEDAFARLSRRPGWSGGAAGETLVALKRGHAWLHLEPGGQTELAASAQPDLHALARELADVRREMAQEAEALGFAYLSHALQPVTSAAEVAMVPKRRYRALRDYLESHGQARAVEMMMLTASVQACFDYRDEADAGRKLRLALLAAPVATALFANSPVERGRASGLASGRAAIWLETDPARCGLPPGLLDGAWSFERYVDFALDVPAVLVRTGDDTVEPGDGRTFAQMLADGIAGRRATMADWELHLSTLFIEARMKKFIEVRSCDCPPPEAALSVPAFWTGLLYHDAATEAALALLEPRRAALAASLGAVAREGLRARIGEVTAAQLARELVALAAQGLAARGLGEAAYLEPAERWAATGRTSADEALEDFASGGVRALIDRARLRP